MDKGLEGGEIGMTKGADIDLEEMMAESYKGDDTEENGDNMSEWTTLSEEELGGVKSLEELDERIKIETNERSEEDEEVLPPGWMVRVRGRVVTFTVEGGRRVVGRRAALQYMLQQGHREEHLEGMRRRMGVDGWGASPHLPQGWMFRQIAFPCRSRPGTQARQVWLLTSEGALFNSYRKAVDYMGVSGVYTAEDVAGVARLARVKAGGRGLAFYQWMEDPRLPAGWRVRDGGAIRFFLTPDSRQVTGDKAALQEVTREGTREERHQMKSFMLEHGWRSSDYLPPGWIFTSNPKQHQNHITMISSEGKVFESFKSAQMHIEASLCQEQFSDFVQEVSCQRRMEAHVDWMGNPSLPAG